MMTIAEELKVFSAFFASVSDYAVNQSRGGSGTCRTARSGVDQDLESAVDHALVVEGHRLRVHLGQPRVLHYLGVDLVAMRARLEHDPREHRRLARLEREQPRSNLRRTTEPQ